MRDLIPWGRSRMPMHRGEPVFDSPMLAFRREVDRLFDETFRHFGALSDWRGEGFGWPHVDLVEHDKEIRVTAELPGLEERDIEISVDDDVLTLRGEKRVEHDDGARRYSERFYGRFERQIALPAEVDGDRAKATFKNGVVSIVLPKTERARQHVKRIPLTH